MHCESSAIQGEHDSVKKTCNECYSENASLLYLHDALDCVSLGEALDLIGAASTILRYSL